MWRSSLSGEVENQNQKTGPRGQCGEAFHVTDNNDDECGQAYCNSCNEELSSTSVTTASSPKVSLRN